LLSLPDPHATVARMRHLGVLPVVLPETSPQHVELLGQVVAAEKSQGFAPDPMRRMAALLPPVTEIAEAVSARLRLSRAQRAHLVAVAARVPDDVNAQQALAYRESPAVAADRVLLQGGDASSLNGWNPPRFPMKGGEIVQRGVSAGPRVAAILRKVEENWIEEGFPPRKRVMELLERELSGERGIS
jgi:poly(A) polymerase